MTELNDEVMREAKKSLKEKGIKSEDVKNVPPIYDHHHHRVAHEKIGPPHIILVSYFHGLLGEHPQIHPHNLFLFLVLSRKSLKKLGFLVLP
jgi:hypothetical protein